ncbi:MAG: HAD family phosphatase [Kiritimatiellae bacterium]|nr:HAD family phosphatase [Kiritimatiellia bacterium]MDD4024863.1 HAD family phosphatase [Kiritimatiellia bacterium]
MSIKAVIFDLDGTLVDTELLWADAISAYLADRQCHCPRETVLHIVFGHSWTDIYLALINRFPPLSQIPMCAMADQLRGYYLRLRQHSENVIIESSVKLLKELAQDYPLAIVSGSPRDDVRDAVKLIGAESLVKSALGAEDYSPGKPSPAGFLTGARKLGVNPAECLVFEDSQAGVQAAKAAGMFCVALSRPRAHPQDLSAADLVLDDLADFSVDAFNRRLRMRCATSRNPDGRHNMSAVPETNGRARGAISEPMSGQHQR